MNEKDRRRLDALEREFRLLKAFVRRHLRVRPVGRPPGADEAQQAEIRRLHKAGRSQRWIAEELGLSRRSVETVLRKLEGCPPAEHI